MNHHELLLGELKEFRRTTITELQRIHKDLDALHSNLRTLNAFRKKLTITAGILSGVLSFVATAVVEFMRR